MALAEDNYTGDMVLIDRLSEFYTVNSWSWNEGEVCYFYFVFQGEWYKTDMSSVDGVDLWYYLQKMGEGLYSSRKD